ncbi:MAG: DUF58 domain-containing protein [Clostridiales bacterium]|nr:DUF58 domain-containing protein [Clostridiales bacterium]
MKNIVFERKLNVDRVFPGIPVDMTFMLANYKILPLPWIKITADIPENFNISNQKIYKTKEKLSNEHTIITSLRSYEKLTRKYEVIVEKRGYYSLLDVKITSGDYYGILKSEKNIHLPVTLIVYPRLVPIEKIGLMPLKPSGKWHVKRWIFPDVLDVSGSRDYTYSEPFSDIDWISTAKMNKLQVKKYDYNAKRSAVIFIDIRTHENDWQFHDRDMVETEIEIGASLVDYFYNEKIEFGIATNSKLMGGTDKELLNPKTGLKHKMNALEMMAGMSYYKRQSFSQFMNYNGKKLNKEDVIVYITAYLDDEIKKHLNYLDGKGFRCKIIIVRPQQSEDNIGLKKTVDIVYRVGGKLND